MTASSARRPLPLPRLARVVPAVIVALLAVASVPAGASSGGTGSGSRVSRTTQCGDRTFTVEVRSERRDGRPQHRVRASVRPRGSTTWGAWILQDRRETWTGTARRGALDVRLADLPGSERLVVRLRNDAGAVCSAELTLAS